MHLHKLLFDAHLIEEEAKKKKRSDLPTAYWGTVAAGQENTHLWVCPTSCTGFSEFAGCSKVLQEQTVNNYRWQPYPNLY